MSRGDAKGKDRVIKSTPDLKSSANSAVAVDPSSLPSWQEILGQAYVTPAAGTSAPRKVQPEIGLLSSLGISSIDEWASGSMDVAKVSVEPSGGQAQGEWPLGDIASWLMTQIGGVAAAPPSDTAPRVPTQQVAHTLSESFLLLLLQRGRLVAYFCSCSQAASSTSKEVPQKSWGGIEDFLRSKQAGGIGMADSSEASTAPREQEALPVSLSTPDSSEKPPQGMESWLQVRREDTPLPEVRRSRRERHIDRDSLSFSLCSNALSPQVVVEKAEESLPQQQQLQTIADFLLQGQGKKSEISAAPAASADQVRYYQVDDVFPHFLSRR